MLKAALAGLFLLIGSGPLLAQQLTYTTHIEARKVESVPSRDPLLQQFYEKLSADLWESFIAADAQAPSDVTYTVGDRGLRIESTRPAPMLPAGAVGVLWPDRTFIVLRPDERTFSRFVPTTPPRQLDLENNTLSWKRTGEFQEVAGLRAERVTFENVFANPARPLMEKLAGDSVVVSIGGDAWIADKYKAYATLLSERFQDAPYSFALLNALQREGLILRVVLRSQFFNGYELERSVIRIAEGPMAADLFDIPASFRPTGPGTIEPPQLISRVEPSYTAEAARARIDGEVRLEMIVAEDGSVRDAKVIKSLGYGLDEAAMKSVLQWKYRPGRKDGVPVNVVVTVNFRFTFRERVRPLP